MDSTLKEKLRAAIELEIDKAVERGDIDEDTGDDASLDFEELLGEYTDQQEFIESFAMYLGKYPFTTSVGDYYMAQLQAQSADGDIEKIRKQLQSLTA